MLIKFIKPKAYKGSINYSKIKSKDDKYLICKDRPFGIQRYRIKEDDFNWCTNYKKASNLWYYVHMLGTAHHYSGNNKHPRTGEIYIKQLTIEGELKMISAM